jgi:hypothetical protein
MTLTQKQINSLKKVIAETENRLTEDISDAEVFIFVDDFKKSWNSDIRTTSKDEPNDIDSWYALPQMNTEDAVYYIICNNTHLEHA